MMDAVKDAADIDLIKDITSGIFQSSVSKLTGKIDASNLRSKKHGKKLLSNGNKKNNETFKSRRNVAVSLEAVSVFPNSDECMYLIQDSRITKPIESSSKSSIRNGTFKSTIYETVTHESPLINGKQLEDTKSNKNKNLAKIKSNQEELQSTKGRNQKKKKCLLNRMRIILKKFCSKKCILPAIGTLSWFIYTMLGIITYYVATRPVGFNQTCVTRNCKENVGLYCNSTTKYCHCPPNSEWLPTEGKCLRNITIKSKLVNFENTTSNVPQWTASDVLRFSNGTNFLNLSLQDPNIDFRQITCMKTDAGFKYYVANNRNNSLMVFDENANYMAQSYLPGASGVQAVDDDLYACSITTNTLYKMNSKFDILINISSCSVTPCLVSPKTIIYDKNTNKIYVNGKLIIYIFDRNLTLIDFIDMNRYMLTDITAINIYLNNIYLAADGKIMVLENKYVVSVYKHVCSYSNAWIYSIYFVNDEYMLVSCMANYIQVFHHNGTPTGSTIGVYKPYYVDVDPLGRLIVTRVHLGLTILY